MLQVKSTMKKIIAGTAAKYSMKITEGNIIPNEETHHEDLYKQNKHH